jgi:hypothetical protein
MAEMTQYTGDTSVIADLGTSPQERGLTADQFKAKFDEGLTAFVTWFNGDHKAEFDAYGLAKSKLDATTAPTATDDNSAGYSVNSIWVDVTNDKAYMCLDSTVGAAVWNIITADLSAYALKQQENWIAPTLQNSWINWGSGLEDAGYMKDRFGFVHLKGVIKSGVITSGTTIFTLPEGYRPGAINLFIVASRDGSSNEIMGRINIADTGVVSIYAGGNAHLQLSGITFKAV